MAVDKISEYRDWLAGIGPKPTDNAPVAAPTPVYTPDASAASAAPATSGYQYLNPSVINGGQMTPAQQAISDQANWYRANGYVFDGVRGYVPAAQYDWRSKFGGNNGWTNAYGLTLNAKDYATEADFMNAYNKGIVANNPAILGGVEQKADGSVFIGRDGGMKDDGSWYSGDLYDNGNTMGRFVLTPQTEVRLTGKDGEVLYGGSGVGAGPELMDALSFGVNKGGKSNYNVQTKDANGNWQTVVKGDPGPGLLSNFLTAVGIVGGAALAGSVLLPALGAGAAGGAAGAGAAAGGVGAGAAAGAGALGAAAGGGLGVVGAGGLITVTGAAAGGLGAGALAAGALGAGALGAGAAALGGGGGSGASGGLGSVGADGTITVTGAAPAASGGLSGLGAAAGAAAGAGAATGTATGSAASPVDPATGDIVVSGQPAQGGLSGLGASAVPAAAGAATGLGVVDPATGDITVTGGQGAPVSGVTAGGIAAGTGAAAAAAGSSAAATTPPAAKSPLDKIIDYLQLGALGTGLLGNVLGGSGSGAGTGTIPGGLNGGLNPVFHQTLPTGTIPGGVGTAANFGPRTMPAQDWTKYAMKPEQSFFNYVPQPPAQSGLASLGS
jgi:hypothetical protein